MSVVTLSHTKVQRLKRKPQTDRQQSAEPGQAGNCWGYDIVLASAAVINYNRQRMNEIVKFDGDSN